jgi:hypothetical protein
MRRLLNLFRSQRPAKPATTRRPQHARLGLESLEERCMPSTSSPYLHAVQPTSGQAAVFFLNTRPYPLTERGALMEKTPQGTIVQLTPASTYTTHVSDFSAGLDRAGNPDVFVQLSSGRLEVRDGGHAFTSLNQPESMLRFAAVDGGRAYFEGQDHALWQYTIPYTETITIVSGGHVIRETITLGGWKQLTVPNSVFGLDAVTQPATGSDEVFFIAHDLSLQQFDVASGSLHELATFGNYLTFELSAGLDGNGYAVVWTQDPNDFPEFYDTHSQQFEYAPFYDYWDHLSSYVTSLSASNNNSAMFLYNGQLLGPGGALSGGPSNITAVSAVSSTDGFVMANGHLYEVNGDIQTTTVTWQTWF